MRSGITQEELSMEIRNPLPAEVEAARLLLAANGWEQRVGNPERFALPRPMLGRAEPNLRPFRRAAGVTRRTVGKPAQRRSRSAGKRITSRIESLPPSTIARRSMPMPRPPVGGMPYESAST